MEDENILKILVASDVHLGYKERDSVQEKDSFNSFEEVFAIAKEKKVDFVLLGGDLFHENKPSRRTRHSCMEIMKKYCMGDRPCQVEVLSDQSVDFGHTSRTVTTVNYEDPNINVAMPVFSIHGNHDDPAGAGSMSAIDFLSVAGYLNHFGRTTSLESIQISPVLLKKGTTRLALYGLGSVRDERLHRMFLKGDVKFLRPKEHKDDWFNIMVIHQNRVKHGPTNYIPENFLDSFLDLVVWGHEHECVGNLEWNNPQNFFVLQPGSTVATSLTHGESKKKQVVLLEICGRKMKPEFIELKTARSMYVEDIVLKNVSCIPAPSAPTIEEALQAYCKERVEILLEKAETEHSGHPKQPKLPLVRLRIDYSGGYDVFNTSRFGACFVGRVANPDSIILFQRQAVTRIKTEKENMEEFDSLIVPEVVDKVKIEDFVENFLTQESSLSVLSARGMTLAVQEFVTKQENDAICDITHRQTDKTLKHIKSCEDATEDDTIAGAIQRCKEERLARNAIKKDNAEDDFENEESVASIIARIKLERSAKSISVDDNSDAASSKISDCEQEVQPARKRGTRGGRGSRGGTRGRGRAARGSRGGRASKGAIPMETPKNGNIMDALSARSQRPKRQTRSDIVMEISDSDDNGLQAEVPLSSSSKRRRGVQYDSSDENPFDTTSNRKKRR